MSGNLEMVSPRKIFWHRDKVAAFLAGEPIFPATLELGLTSACNLSCRDCPSRKGRPGLFLDVDLARRLFSLCRGRTFGAIISGGEPTLHPAFGRVLSAARENGFRDIVIISNGTRLNREEVAGALLDFASAVRVSLYDLGQGAPPDKSPTLLRIGRLRDKIEKTGSSLKIGASLLTHGSSLESLRRAAAAVRAAGAHWLYFHPTCVAVAGDAIRAQGQESLLAALEDCRREQAPGFAVHYLSQRYADAPVVFQGYHAAHFIMVVGADGDNYLSSETKYQPRYRIASGVAYGDDDFFQQRERLDKIIAVNSTAYPAGGSRNRGVLYNQELEEAKQGTRIPAAPEFLLPHIL